MYGRCNHRCGGNNHSKFQHSHSSKTEFSTKLFENPSAMKTSAEDSSYRVEVYSSYLTSSFEKNSIGNINISTKKVEEIEKIIKELPPISNVPYEDMKTSQFKVLFLDKRYGDIEQKVDFFMEKMERNPSIDQMLFMENNEKFEDQKFMDIYGKRKRLPAFEKRNQIIKLIEENQVVLISGDTGCGKTTQVAQFILDEYITGYKGSVCKIVCTQPRRISAISVADRVAAERNESLGLSCGYQIRMEKVLPRKYGSILFVTNGIIIRHMENDPSLNNISHLILDEIHERDIHSDFLLGLVKQLIVKRKDLKIILMSATLNEKRFKEFFNFCPHLVIQGLSHPVDEYFLEDIIDRLHYKISSSINHNEACRQYSSNMFMNKVLPYVNALEEQGKFPSSVCMELRKPSSEEMNMDLIYKLTMDICKHEEAGAILIFVTGYEDINNLYELFSDLPEAEYMLIALHSQIAMDEQRSVFDEPPPGVRKIIISTNIAETSITIDDVVYVIDGGWAKVKTYDARTKTENLEPRFISRANAIQRKGRAGRLQAGKCFRLYTKGRYEAFFEYQKPEILRTRLENIILQAKLLMLGKVRPFFEKLLLPFIVDCSLSLLDQLGALDEEESLTPLGYYLAKLPISPQLGKMLLFGVFFKCLDPILNIAVALDFKSPFILAKGAKKNQGQELIKFSEGVKSDHLLLHKSLAIYQKIDKRFRQEYCKKFNLDKNTMKTIKKMKNEFMENLMNLQLVGSGNSTAKDYNLYSNNIELVKSIVCAGLYPNIIIACPSVPRMIFQTIDGRKVGLHKKSILAEDRFFSCPLLAYYIKMKTKMDMVHDATVCSPYPIIFFADIFRIEKSMHSHYIIANNLKFKCEKSTATVIQLLRDRLQQFLLYCLMNPKPIELKKDEKDEKFLKIIVDLLASPEA